MSIFIYSHTTPTGYFYMPNQNYDINFSFYYRCVFGDERIYYKFLELRIKSYLAESFCNDVCSKLYNILHTNFTSRLAKDDFDNLICLCSPKYKFAFQCDSKIHEKMDLSQYLEYMK